MNRDEFCKYHWEYYLVLEKDFLETERYISFDLGDNYLYDERETTNIGNSMTFSGLNILNNIKTVCSEIDVVMKSICNELGNSSADNIKGYTPVILSKWSNITQQKVKIRDIELQPFMNWKDEPNHKSPDWWKPYNKVEHERIDYYKMANLKNVLNSLAGLFILENYFIKYIGDRDNDMDVPNDISKMFKMINFDTREEVVGKNSYVTSDGDIADLFK